MLQQDLKNEATQAQAWNRRHKYHDNRNIGAITLFLFYVYLVRYLFPLLTNEESKTNEGGYFHLSDRL